MSVAVAEAADLPVPTGLGAGDPLGEQVGAMGGGISVLLRELAVRMAALEREDPRSDPRGLAIAAGIGSAQAAQLRVLGRFAHDHPAIGDLWMAGAIGIDQVRAVQAGQARLGPRLQDELARAVAPALPGLDPRATRQLVDAVADQLQPGDPDLGEQSEHAARHLTWTDTPRGGMAFQGYLPQTQADQLRAIIRAKAEQLRAQGDGLSQRQRYADALSEVIAEANLDGPATGGGLPAVLTMTVSLTEAERIADRDPAQHGTLFQTRPQGDGRIHGQPAGDAAIRFGLCCAAITPLAHHNPRPRSGTSTRTGTGTGTGTSGGTGGGALGGGSLLDAIAATTLVPLAVGRAVRLATPAMRTALKHRDGGCVIPGCDIQAGYTEPHHVIGWALGGPTDLDNLVSLCFVHHQQTELGRYTFTRRQPGHPKPDGAHEHPLWWITPPHRQ